MQTTTDTATAATPAAIIRPGKRLATIEQTAKLYPVFPPAALRDMKFKAFDRKNSRGEIIKGNGTGEAGVWLQIGRKVIVDLDAFEAWIDGHRGEGQPCIKPDTAPTVTK